MDPLKSTLAWLAAVVGGLALAAAHQPASPWARWHWQPMPGARPLRVSAGPLLISEEGTVVDPQTSLELQPLGFPVRRRGETPLTAPPSKRGPIHLLSARRLDRDHLLLDDELYEVSTGRRCSLGGRALAVADSDAFWIAREGQVGVARPGETAWVPSQAQALGAVGNRLLVRSGSRLTLLDASTRKVWTAQVPATDVLVELSPARTRIGAASSSGRRWLYEADTGRCLSEKQEKRAAGILLCLLWYGETDFCPYAHTSRSLPYAATYSPQWEDSSDPPTTVFLPEDGNRLLHKATGKTFFQGWRDTVSPDGNWAVVKGADNLVLIDHDGHDHALGEIQAEAGWVRDFPGLSAAAGPRVEGADESCPALRGSE